MKPVITASRIAIVGVALLANAVPALSAEAGRDAQSFWGKYGLVVQRNIFSRTRTAPSMRPPSVPSSGGPSRPEQAFVLTGIIREEVGDGCVAFIEDRRAGTTLKVPLNGTVAQGKIVKVDFSGVEYEAAGQRIKVMIGDSFAGGPPSAASFSGTSSPSSSTTSGSSTESAGGNSDIAERMRQRRMAEMGK